jgi:hypothetical protein
VPAGRTGIMEAAADAGASVPLPGGGGPATPEELLEVWVDKLPEAAVLDAEPLLGVEP